MLESLRSNCSSCLIHRTSSREIFLLEDPYGGSPGLALLLGSPSVEDEVCVLAAGPGQQAAVQGVLPAVSSCSSSGSSSLVSWLQVGKVCPEGSVTFSFSSSFF